MQRQRGLGDAAAGRGGRSKRGGGVRLLQRDARWGGGHGRGRDRGGQAGRDAAHAGGVGGQQEEQRRCLLSSMCSPGKTKLK